MFFRTSLTIAALAISATSWAAEPKPSFDGTRIKGSYWGIAQTGSTTVAVGTGGALIYKSGSQRWTVSQRPGSQQAGKPLLLAVDAAGGGHFIAVGGTGFTSGKGVVLRSSDNGKSFQAVASPAAPLYEVKFHRPDAGVAVGVDGLVLRSTDGGANWQRLETNSKTKFWGLHFFSDSVGLVGGGETPWQNNDRSSGEILRTEDGGASWTKVYEGAKRISDFSFLSDDLGYAAGVGGLLLKTSDGGRSWREAGQTPLKAIVNALAFISEDCGLIVGAGGTAYITHDGGKSWNQRVQVTQGSFLEDLAADEDDGKAFWVAGGDGSLGRIHLGNTCDR